MIVVLLGYVLMLLSALLQPQREPAERSIGAPLCGCSRT